MRFDAHILVCDPDPQVRDVLQRDLGEAGFPVTTVDNIRALRAIAGDATPDLLVLDWNVPGLCDGEYLGLIKGDRTLQGIPLIVLSTSGEPEDKARALEGGADDCLSKPFSTRELILRIKSILRSVGRLREEALVEAGGIVLDSRRHRVAIGERIVPLRPSEYRLLEFLMAHPETAFSRIQLRDLVWGRDAFEDERTVDVHIQRLRKALEAEGRKGLIQTVRGYGYRFSTRP